MVGRHNSRKRHRPGEERFSQKLAAGAVILGVVLIFAAGSWLLGERKAAFAALDPDSFCPKAGPSSVVSVLIDRTDPLTEIQAEALQIRMQSWARDIPKYGAFRVYEVGVGGALLAPVVSVCNPGDGSDLSSIDSNPAFWRKRYEEKFMAPITAMIAAMRTDTTAPLSPIMEAVQAISVRDFGPNAPVTGKSLIIVSDLLQNGPDLSLYKGVPDTKEFFGSPAGRALHADLGGVAFSIYFLNRRNAATKQTNALGEFWIRWLQLQGGEPAEHVFTPIPG